MIDLQRETDLVCEALVREIRDANRWSAVKEAWEALLHVRRMSREMIAEQGHLTPSVEDWRHNYSVDGLSKLPHRNST